MTDQTREAHFAMSKTKARLPPVSIYQEAHCDPQSLRLEVLGPTDVNRVGFPIKSYRILEIDEACVSENDFCRFGLPTEQVVDHDFTMIRCKYINWLHGDVEERLAKEIEMPRRGKSMKLAYFWYKHDDIDFSG